MVEVLRGRIYQRSTINLWQKDSWLGVEDIHEVCRVDLHPSLVGDTRENFYPMPDDRLSSKMCQHTQYSQSLPGASCLEVSGGNNWKSCGERAKLMSWDCVMLVGPLKA